ncbi:MAG: PH domain-containing protein [Clostridia bacterium]|nr:PH domain-containing protein [Clostridia bacterium]
MGRYVEKNLYENELIVEKARRDRWGLVGWWTFGILCCWMLLIPFFLAIWKTVVYTHTELVLTNKRVVYKFGVFNTQAFDAPLDKIVNVHVKTTFWGRIFNTNKIRIAALNGSVVERIENADDFKSTILGQIDHYQEARAALQASWTARAIANANAPKAVAPKKKKAKKKKNPEDEYDYE